MQSNIFQDRKRRYDRMGIEGKIRIANSLCNRMISEDAVDISDEEIERTISGCVMGATLVIFAKELRNDKLLTIKMLRERSIPIHGETVRRVGSTDSLFDNV